MRALLVLVVVAGVGVAACLVVHIAALAGVKTTLGIPVPGAVVATLAPVWIAAVVVSGRLAQDVPRRQLWAAVFRNGPRWLKPAAFAAGGYAIACLLLLGLFGRLDQPDGLGKFRVGSAYAFAFYFMAAAILYCGAITSLNRRRCPHGHAVSPLAQFCEVCGESLASGLSPKSRLNRVPPNNKPLQQLAAPAQRRYIMRAVSARRQEDRR